MSNILCPICMSYLFVAVTEEGFRCQACDKPFEVIQTESLEEALAGVKAWVRGSPPHPSVRLRKDKLTTDELRHLIEERIIKETRPAGGCQFCQSDDIPTITTTILETRKVRFTCNVCCEDVRRLVDQWIDEATARLQAWDEVMRSDFPQKEEG